MRLMADLALEARLEGELRLYDIDLGAPRRNEALGNAIFQRPDAMGGFVARAVETPRGGPWGGRTLWCCSSSPDP